MRLLALATVTSNGRPVVGPVDGIFYRGAFHFGSAPDSLRFRHIRSRPHVSATHLPLAAESYGMPLVNRDQVSVHAAWHRGGPSLRAGST